MIKNSIGIKAILAAFCVLYGTSFLAINMNPEAFGGAGVPGHVVLLKFLFLTLTIATLALVTLKNWARLTFLSLNGAMCLYLIGVMIASRDIYLLAYILVNAVALMFFADEKASVPFERKKKISRKSILIVDDDEGSLKTVKSILLPNGYSVLTASSGEKGMQIAKMQKPDLIILDVILPGIKGREACTRLKEDKETAKIPVVFLTAKDSLDDIHAEIAAGAISHLTKPVNAKILLAEVKRIFDLYRV
jgi:CheY-like chemotaxis protein